MPEGKNRLLIGKAIPLPVLPLNAICGPWWDHKGQKIPVDFRKELTAQLERLMALPGLKLVGLTGFHGRLGECQTVKDVNVVLMDLYEWCDQHGVQVPGANCPATGTDLRTPAPPVG